MDLFSHLLLLSMFLVLLWLFLRHRQGPALPLGPHPLPLLGTLHKLNLSRVHESFMQLAVQYGNVYTLWMGSKPVVVLSGFYAVREALASEAFLGRSYVSSMCRLIGNKGILMSNGKTWKQQRKFVLVALRNLGLGKKSMEQKIREEADYLLGVIAREEGKPLDPSTMIHNAVSNVIVSVVFGQRMDLQEALFLTLMESIHSMMHFQGSASGQLYDAFPGLMHLLPGPHKRAFAHADNLKRYIGTQIQEHRHSQHSEPRDFIDWYLSQINKTSADPESTFNDDSMLQVVMDLFFAGSESVATTLLWALLYMVTNPGVQERVQEELDSVVGCSAPPRYEDRQRLPYTSAVVHETQRYSNIVAGGAMRLSTRETSVQGHHIPKGTMVLPCLPSVLFDPEQWETPDKFNPGHFLDQEGNFRKREAFLPFSSGPRGCLGEQLARVELFVFFSSLLQRFTFTLPSGVTEPNMDYELGAILTPHPFQICAVLR
ncbi:cytochrome P450 2J5-like isoform X2 [Polyodon spathula]|uniref:cytochrome P450 2J5-like isoform X2 n=1 Tax=Polyodon spathula TaxID=7913 RepID=UPI001B7E7AEE|nr:cytochrome P450 2J5-like isoform X2 [Polyodon spathula]